MNRTRILLLIVIFLQASFCLQAQKEVFGFRHYQTVYKKDTVNILIKSKKGEEHIKKPLFLFCQGSLPVPLIITHNQNGKTSIYYTPVFNTDSMLSLYHLVLINKPFVPLIASENSLSKQMTFEDSAGNFSLDYTKRNYLDYYVDRNILALKFLQKLSFVSSDKLVVSGHSEGAVVAANMACKYKKVRQLIYVSGSPLGRINTIIAQRRYSQFTDSTININSIFERWKTIVDDKNNDVSYQDTNKGTYSFSNPPIIEKLIKLNIPVLVCYVTKDFGAVHQNDYLRIATISKQKNNFTFKAYVGLDHNFFSLLPNGKPNYDDFNWDKVAQDWLSWLKEN